MNHYLTPEQQAEFEKQLAQGGLSEEQAQDAFAQGADMARAEMAQAEPNDASADALRKSGFGSVQALLDAYEESQAALGEARDTLEKLRALVRALDAEGALSPDAPEERGRAVQREWTRRAVDMRDIERLLPDMAEYILAHPASSLEEDGLERAYDAVRSKKYRSDEELLDDPESVKRLAADPRVKNAVLTAHLSEVYRAGKDLPSFIDGGGVAPADEGGTDGMAQAGEKLRALLKLAGRA